eukprot:756954-Hanusia_phi.AAC.2
MAQPRVTTTPEDRWARSHKLETSLRAAGQARDAAGPPGRAAGVSRGRIIAESDRGHRLRSAVVSATVCRAAEPRRAAAAHDGAAAGGAAGRARRLSDSAARQYYTVRSDRTVPRPGPMVTGGGAANGLDSDSDRI